MADMNNFQANKEYKFALDIGTRTVIGILTSKQGKSLIVEDYEIVEHPDRAMFDGQVHDIMEVSEVVRGLKETLEERNAVKLDAVSIAAAGRALRTEKVVLEKKLDMSEEITQELLDSLEMEAIQIAGEKIKKSVPVVNTLYYCVGYSIVGINLDGINIRNPIGHSASNIKFALVATFLPHNVSDTLHKVVINAGLKIESMTLEPIAALEVSVPNNLRLLNLAIVDIGAGTSDIALTKNGNIFSYGMVDVAGDEITENLMKEYLLDFNEAEKLKLNLIREDSQKIVDIVGIEYDVKTSEVIDSISSTLDEIAEKIGHSVHEINKQVPDAVFLVGGSSQMPTLKERIARAIKIDDKKINLKSSDKLANVEYKIELLKSPEFVTPIGIAYMSHFVKQREFVSVLINSKIYRLFNRQNLTISDALVLAGFNAKRLIQTRGKALAFTVDGEEKIIQGEAGEASRILLNAKPVTIYSPIKHMDMIEITKPVVGKDATATLEDVIDYNAYIFKDRVKTPLVAKVFVNGEEQDKTYQICNDDNIVVQKSNEEEPKVLRPNARSTMKIDEFNDIDDDFAEQSLFSDYHKDEEYFDNFDDESLIIETESINARNTRSEVIEEEHANDLNLLINKRALKIKPDKDTYYLEDLLSLLNYNINQFGEKFAITINGVNIENNCVINDGDDIVFSFK